MSRREIATSGLQVAVFTMSATNTEEKERKINDWLAAHEGCVIVKITDTPVHAGLMVMLWYREDPLFKLRCARLEAIIIKKLLAAAEGAVEVVAEQLDYPLNLLKGKIRQYGISSD